MAATAALSEIGEVRLFLNAKVSLLKRLQCAKVLEVAAFEVSHHIASLQDSLWLESLQPFVSPLADAPLVHVQMVDFLAVTPFVHTNTHHTICSKALCVMTLASVTQYVQSA